MRVIDLLNDIVNGKTHYDYIKYYNRNSKKYDIMFVEQDNIIYRLNKDDIFLEDEIEQYKEEDNKTEDNKINITINGEPRTLNLEVLEPIELKEHDRIEKINGEWYLIKFKED